MEQMEKNPADAAQPGTAGLDVLTDSAREWRSWIITIGIAAVLSLLIILYRNNRDSGEQKASRMLGEARNVQALQAVISQHPSSAAARQALLLVAKAQYDNSDFVAAQASYKEFLAKYADHPMAPIAELGVIQCVEGLGQTAQALTSYEAYAQKNKESYLAPIALFGKARCLQSLKRVGEAKAVYEDFLVSHPKSDWQNEVQEALKQLALQADAAKP